MKRDFETQSRKLCVCLHLLHGEGPTFQGRIGLFLDFFLSTKAFIAGAYFLLLVDKKYRKIPLYMCNYSKY
jgi:hypothetical protein